MKIKYNKSVICKRAWKLFNSQEVKSSEVFAECMRKSWHIAKNGSNANTFEEIYKQFYKPILHHVTNKIHRVELAEEITSDVFMRVYKHLETYDVYKAKLNTWIFTIAHRLTIDYTRKFAIDNLYVPTSTFVDDDNKDVFTFVDNSEDASSEIEHSELNSRVSNAMNSLKPKYKQIIELCIVKELSHTEIAEILQCSEGNVRVMVMRAKQLLQQAMQLEVA